MYYIWTNTYIFNRLIVLSHALYRWTTHKITLAYIVTQSVSNFGNDDILREDNMNNVVRLLNKKSQFAGTLVTDHDVMFFKRKDESIIRFVN
jgi:hypothetical protein